MMLQPIEQLIPDPFDRLFCQMSAVDPESGAYLLRSHGRGKGGLPKYILILPNKPVSERESIFKLTLDWENKDRKFIRAWTFQEALETANTRLEKMLRLRQVSAARPTDTTEAK